MIKIIAPNSQNFGDSVSSLIKVSERGLVGSDLSAFVKRAGSEAAHNLKGLDFKPGEQPIHMIAIGSTEAYGPNRNGDGFKEATCNKHHNTFVKHARWYRNHKNKDTQKSYGIIKSSMFNDKMKRIELIVALNATKEAADRNKGLVADKEMQKIASGDENWGVSMACRVAHDICSGCGNKAKNRDEYCTEDMCKYGGCKSNLTKVAEDGHVLHVDNPNPTWFDISDVYRPADRIAWVVGHYKAASGLYVAGGAELAEMAGVESPYDLITNDLQGDSLELAKIAIKLAGLELASYNCSSAFLATVANRVRPMAVWKQASVNGNYPWAECARQGVLVSIEDWLAAKGHSVKIAQEVKQYLPGIFSSLIGDVSTIEKLSYDRSSDPSRTVSTERQSLEIIKQASSHSVGISGIEKGIRSAVISGFNTPCAAKFEKTASIFERYSGLAQAYAVHQLQWIKAASVTEEQESNYARVVAAYNIITN